MFVSLIKGIKTMSQNKFIRIRCLLLRIYTFKERCATHVTIRARTSRTQSWQPAWYTRVNQLQREARQEIEKFQGLQGRGVRRAGSPPSAGGGRSGAACGGIQSLGWHEDHLQRERQRLRACTCTIGLSGKHNATEGQFSAAATTTVRWQPCARARRDAPLLRDSGCGGGSGGT